MAASATQKFPPATPEIVRFASVGKVDEIKRVMNENANGHYKPVQSVEETSSATNVLQEAYLDFRTPLHVAAAE